MDLRVGTIAQSGSPLQILDCGFYFTLAGWVAASDSAIAWFPVAANRIAEVKHRSLGDRNFCILGT